MKYERCNGQHICTYIEIYMYASTAENSGKFTKPIGICWLFTHSYIILFFSLHWFLLISVAPFSVVIHCDNVLRSFLFALLLCLTLNVAVFSSKRMKRRSSTSLKGRSVTRLGERWRRRTISIKISGSRHQKADPIVHRWICFGEDLFLLEFSTWEHRGALTDDDTIKQYQFSSVFSR